MAEVSPASDDGRSRSRNKEHGQVDDPDVLKDQLDGVAWAVPDRSSRSRDRDRVSRASLERGGRTEREELVRCVQARRTGQRSPATVLRDLTVVVPARTLVLKVAVIDVAGADVDVSVGRVCRHHGGDQVGRDGEDQVHAVVGRRCIVGETAAIGVEAPRTARGRGNCLALAVVGA